MIERISSMLDETELKRKWLIEEKPHTCEEVGGTPQNFLLAFIDELWETRKIRILKKWKKIAGKIEEKKKTIAHFTHVYQKLQPYEEQFLRYRVRQLFCHFGPFFAL